MTPPEKSISEAETKNDLPLQSGDRLSRAEFERRRQAHPEIKRAELIEGFVFLPSPIRFQKHADPHFALITWLGNYQAATPGVLGGDNASLRLDFENEVQPDALLRLDPQVGGQSFITEDGYLEGAPELIVEVAASGVSYDMHDKRHIYARNGVQEHLVFLAYEQRVIWFVLQEEVYTQMQSDDKGIIRSEVFPGLWLDDSSLLAGDLTAILACLQKGLHSAEYKTYSASLKAKLNAQDPPSLNSG